MPERSSKKRPRDLNSLAHQLTQEATGEAPSIEPQPEREKDPAAVELGRRGGLKGGRARAEKLTAEQRSESARRAATKRWEYPREDDRTGR